MSKFKMNSTIITIHYRLFLWAYY